MTNLFNYLYYNLGEALFPDWFDPYPYAEQAYTFAITFIYVAFFLSLPFFIFRFFSWLWSLFRRF